jgi:hypothetical protein
MAGASSMDASYMGHAPCTKDVYKAASYAKLFDPYLAI